MITITFIIAILALIGTAANAWQLRWCFIIWMGTNAFWSVYDWYIGSYAQSGLFAAYLVLAVVGWFKWKAKYYDENNNCTYCAYKTEEEK